MLFCGSCFDACVVCIELYISFVLGLQNLLLLCYLLHCCFFGICIVNCWTVVDDLR